MRQPSGVLEPPLGTRLRALRRKNGRSVSETADEIGITSAMLYQIEQGRAQPSIRLLNLLADQYHTSISDMFANFHPPLEADAEEFSREFSGHLTGSDWELLRRFASRLALANKRQ